MESLDTQMNVIKRGAVDVLPEELLREKLARSIRTNTPLVVKQGFDPTAPDIHLGHVVCLRKLRQFQDLGHRVVFLIGDFTGLIGDPSGRSDTRKRMTREQLLENAETYKKQTLKILDPKTIVFDFNSRWLAKLTFTEVLDLTATQTVARLLERDDFFNRYKQNKPISLLEFVYPLTQGYDSVALHADVELGGTDQTFNLLMAREIQKAYQQEPQVIVTMPILEGTDGVDKMSKSLGNYIGISETPETIFGKTMSIPDTLILRYFELVSSKSLRELEAIRKRLDDAATNPSHVKRELARDLVAQFHGDEAARRAEAYFDTIHVKKDLPEDTETVRIAGEPDGLWIVKALTESGMCRSSSDARRMVTQGAVSIDGERVVDIELRLQRNPDPVILKVGKRKFIGIIVD
jgi:tyrosyl-tRNA synthetase